MEKIKGLIKIFKIFKNGYSVGVLPIGFLIHKETQRVYILVYKSL